MKRKARPESARECTEVHDQADYRGATPRFALVGERIGRKRCAWSVVYIKRRKSLSFPIFIAFRTIRRIIKAKRLSNKVIKTVATALRRDAHSRAVIGRRPDAKYVEGI